MRRRFWTALAVLPALTLLQSAEAVIIYSTSGATVQQNFDSLGTSGSLPWNNDSTLNGWSLFKQPTPGTALTSIAAGDGGSNAGGIYSFGTGTSTDRALGGIGSGGTYFGSPASGAVAAWIAVAVKNTTGFTATSFSVSFDGEQWRNGGNTTAQTMTLQYGFGNSFDTVATWTTPGGNFNFTSPVTGASGVALDGNAAANRVANRGGTISNLTWSNNSTLWIRWIENNDTGNDHGLAIDNFQFSAIAVPEPSTTILVAVSGLLTVIRRRR